jgi:hypothetical protein
LNRKLQWIVAGGALAVIAVCLAVIGLYRVQEVRAFGRPHRVQTYGGTNYVVRLAETTIGRTDSGRVVIVRLILANPNPFDIVLDRNWFILVDMDKDYFLPTPAGAEAAAIKVPARAVRDDELLTYAVDETSFDGTLGLFVGHHYVVLLKGIEPYTRELAVGEYRSFRRADW